MWKIAVSIFLGFTILSFNYVWMNRFEVIEHPNYVPIIINKWTGEGCYLMPSRPRPSLEVSTVLFDQCKTKPSSIGDWGGIKLP